MSDVARLPWVAGQIRVPNWLTPTQMGRALACPLSAILGSTLETDDRLPPDPRAILGTVLHKVVEDSAMGRVTFQGRPREALRHHLDRLLADQEKRLREIGLGRYVPLRSTQHYTEYLERVNRALRQAESFAREAAPHVAERTALRGQPADRAVPEQKVASESLRLVGRVDWWEEHGDEVKVRDLKTGVVREGDRIARHVEFQLRLYGLLAVEARPGKRVRLFVDHEGTEELPWGDAEEAETRAQVAAIRRDLPSGQVVDPTAVAQVGEACRWCDVRHHCVRYRTEAPRLWTTTDLGFVPPQDIAGDITEAVLQKDPTTVRLRDLGGRHVTIAALQALHGDFWLLPPTTQLWFFGLEPRGSTKDPDGRYRHPTNFRELAMGPGERPAWRLRVLRGL